ncbi:uncharacterized protein LOC141906222 [Tubulanus polymorphus]|uniref:uncharacterized protein LOC141906222 n=1 Tax=Tubulanus polymorphus TaxID=672921 RepID=UPI003DA5B106
METVSDDTEISLLSRDTFVYLEPIIDLSHFSSLRTLLRTTAYVFRYINCLKSKIRNTDELTISELHASELFLVKSVQNTHYNHEIKCLSENLPSRQYQIINQLRLFLKDRILRSAGRIHNAHIPSETRFPILLPPNDPYTKLVVWDSHNRSFHQGVNQTVTVVRKKVLDS